MDCADYCAHDHTDGPCSSQPDGVPGVDVWRVGDDVVIDADAGRVDKTAWDRLKEIVEGLWSRG